MIAWNKGHAQSISDTVGKALDEPVQNKAINGARFLPGFINRLDINKQLTARPWDWVILNGGGNDLWLGCGCSKCATTLDRLVSSDGLFGAVPRVINKLRKTGAKVIFIGYLRSPGRSSIIDHCKDDAQIYEARLKKMAHDRKGIYFLSIADLVPNGDTSFHAIDRIHPSTKGSRAIGQRVAALIKRVDHTR